MISNHNPLLKIATAAMTGTSAMTFFSYAVSQSKNKQFREPEILARLINRLRPGNKRKVSRVEGWLVHYTVGTLFSVIYHNFNQNAKTRSSTLKGLLLGSVTGLLGISVWRTVLNFHPFPPTLDRTGYYRHLFVAHLIFGLFTAWSYNITESKNPARHF